MEVPSQKNAGGLQESDCCPSFSPRIQPQKTANLNESPRVALWRRRPAGVFALNAENEKLAPTRRGATKNAR
jgi:hypothetical protein